jgi:hypothetical protein
MKAFGAAIAAGVILFGGSLLSTDVSAQTIRLGPGGVRIDTDRDHRDRWDRRDRCRTVVERHRNRLG